jgi:hypothetical protein
MTDYLLPNVQSNAVIVMDRARYHTACTQETKGPQSGWTKLALAEYIVARSSDYTLDGLLNRVREVQDNGSTRRYTGLLQTGLHDGTDIQILFLPVAHPQLNPIEIIWSRIKTFVASRNFNDADMMARIRGLAHEKHESVTAEDWEKVYQKSRVFALDCMDVDDCDDITNYVKKKKKTAMSS